MMKSTNPTLYRWSKRKWVFDKRGSHHHPFRRDRNYVPPATLCHTIALQRAKRNYESERLRQLQLSVANELEWKDYTDHLSTTSAGPVAAATAAQQRIVDELNHSRKTLQEQVLLPQLVAVERQYQDLVQKNLQLRSAIADVQGAVQQQQHQPQSSS
jgi:Breast carcinoma amplified sequence 2 (BCAS2)